VPADEPFGLERFVRVQDEGGTYDRALGELQRGRKSSHWMWFVFPQIAGLGHSAMSQRYAIRSLDEAEAYLRHAVLGARLVACARCVAETVDRTAEDIFGGIDAQKLHSSMTLFARAAPDIAEFGRVLDKYFDAVADPATIAQLRVSARRRDVP
jgi:uncharacterized protein (DUF1810 family)